MDRIDIHDSKDIFNYYYKRIDSSSMSDDQKIKIKRFIKEAQMGKNSTRNVGNRRLIANLQSFFRLFEYFKKDFDKLEEAELEKFYSDIQEDRIKKANGGKYKSSSKVELIKNLKRYLKWVWKDPDKYNSHARWMREKEEITEIPAITKEQIEKVINTMQYLRDKTLTMLAWDSGGRIEELLNLKIKDIEKNKKKDGEFYYTIKIDGTKTKEAKRNISIPYATSLMSEWLREHPAITDKEALLFDITYDAYRKVLRMNGKKAINQIITPHQLRHSSATFYCPLINNDRMFCYRYGWSFGSKQARRYIDRNRLGEEAQEELDNLIKGSKVEDLQEQVNQLSQTLENFKKMMVVNAIGKAKVSEEEQTRVKQAIDLILNQ